MKKIIVYDDYNNVIPPPEKQNVIGTVRQTFSRSALRASWKIIEIYEEDS